MTSRFQVDAVDAEEALRDSALVGAWDALVDGMSNENMLFVSPAWVGHLLATSNAPLRLWCVRDHAGALIGVVPVRTRRYDLPFSVLNRVLARRSLATAHILGGLPLLPECPETIGRVLNGIFEDWPHCDCLYFAALPTDSYFWRHIESEDGRGLAGYTYVVDGPRPWHLLDLDESFEAYLGTLSAKSRATLRRKARQAGNTPHGPVDVQRVTDVADVRGFLESAVAVSRQSWQHKVLGERLSCDDASVREIEDLARRGLLRCYLLNLGSTPSAFVLGYQHADVYHYAELGFREDMAKLSPGTVLLYFIVEDLHAHDRPRTLNFGEGDASYKRRFGNRERRDVSCLILRRGVSNKLVTGAHAVFIASVEAAKKLIGRRVTR